jgi:outer membrane protein, heavy metal efflux system
MSLRFHQIARQTFWHVISHFTHRFVHALKLRNQLLIFLTTVSLLGACANQTYEAKPIDAARLTDSFGQRTLDSEELHRYMLAQGYPENAFPIKQWGLYELTLAAFLYNPQLDVARAKWRAAQAAQVTAGQKQNPGVSGYLQSNSQTSGGLSPWTYGISFAVPVETGGKRQVRMAQAASLSEAARIEIGQSAWQVRSQLRDSLLGYQAALLQISLLQREVALYEEIVQMLEKRLEAGLASSIDLSNVRLQLQKARQSLEAENNRLTGLRTALDIAIGLPAGALAAVKFDTTLPDRTTSSDPLSDRDIRQNGLLNRLDIRSALARYAAAEANLQLEIARQYPDFSIAPGYAWDQGNVQWSLGLSTILSLINKNEGPIAEARAARDLQASQFSALQVNIIGELEKSHVIQHAAQRRAARASELLAAQQQRLAQAERQFERGYADRLELTQNRLEALVAEQGMLEARIQAQRTLNALEDAVQRPLDGSVPLPEIPQEISTNE